MKDERDFGIAWVGDSPSAKLFLSYYRRFPRHRGKGRICRWILRSRFRNELPMRTSFGSRIRLDPNDYIGRRIISDGGYEPKSMALAVKLMQPGGVFVDLGCNFGLYTMVLGNLPGVQCIAIDASFLALSRFVKNLELNPRIKATVVASAVSPEHALHWFTGPTNSNLGAIKISQQERNSEPNGFWAMATSLETILKKVAPGQVRLLKADLEGHELSVFKDFDFDGPFRPKNILVECDPGEFQSAQSCFEFIKRKGYSSRTVFGDFVGTCDKLPEFNVWFQDEQT